MSFWVSVPAVINGNVLLSKGGGGGSDEYLVSLNSQGFYFRGSWRSSACINSVPSNTWTLVTATFTQSDNTMRFYQNGAFCGSIPSISQAYAADTSHNFNIGQQGDSYGGNKYYGTADEIRMSNSVRSADWVKAEYNTESDSMNTFGATESYWNDTSYLNRSKITLNNSNLQFSDDLETGDFSKWTSTTGTITIDAAEKSGGAYSTKIISSAGVTDAVKSITANASASAVGNFYATTQPAADAILMSFFDHTSASTKQLSVYRAASTGNLCIKAKSASNYCTSTAFPLNQWNKIEVNTTPANAATGSYVLSLNGARIKAGGNVDTGTTTFDRFEIGDYGSNTQTFWVDDVSVFANPVAGDLSSFPVLVKLTDARIDYTKVHLAGTSPDYPKDIRFMDDGGNLLKYEVESWYDSSHNSYVWVKVPTVPGGDGSLTKYIYIYYNNASASDGQTPTTVWDSTFLDVWHLKETPGGAGTIKDSTSNAHNGTPNGTVAMGSSNQVAGKVDGSLCFNAVCGSGTNQNVDFGNITSTITGLSHFTFSAWVKKQQAGATAETGQQNGSGSILLEEWGDGSTNFFVGNGGFGQITLDDGNWHFLTTTFDGTKYTGNTSANPNVLKGYVDGVLQTLSYTDVVDATTASGSDNFRLAKLSDNTIGDQSNDEVRLSNSTRTSDWVLADYKAETDAMNNYAAADTYSSASSYSDTIGTVTAGVSDNMSVVVDPTENMVHVTYIDAAGKLEYADYSTSWNTSSIINTSTGSTYPTLSVESSTNNLYVIWDNSNDLNYMIGTYSSGSHSWTWGSVVPWKTSGTNVAVTSDYSASGQVFAEWMVTDASPYNVMWDKIVVPEQLWWLFGVVPLLQRWLKNRRLGKKKKRLRQYLKLLNSYMVRWLRTNMARWLDG